MEKEVVKAKLVEHIHRVIKSYYILTGSALLLSPAVDLSL